MISSVRGTVLEVALGHCVIEVGGVGMRINATPAALAQLRRGEEGFLHTTLVVREDSLTLFGFESAASREIFVLVQSVSGIGPRIALAVVATMPPERLAAAIRDNDIKAIQKVPGVGKRTAERMVLDLRDKLPGVATEQVPVTGVSQLDTTQTETAGVSAEVTAALEGLGFAAKDASRVVEATVAAHPDAQAPAILRIALQSLGPGK